MVFPRLILGTYLILPAREVSGKRAIIKYCVPKIIPAKP
jgi:hypothetical protein